MATGPAKKQLSIATYNVENLAATDPASKFQALADGVVHNLADPDIIAVEEVQDNDGATDDGVVAADQTIAKLTAAITAAGGPDVDRSTTGTQVVKKKGEPALSLSPGRLDPANPVWTASRKPPASRNSPTRSRT